MRILSGMVVAAAVLLGLTGCSPTPPPIELPPSPSSTPLFASEEEALAAAEEVYGAYSRAANQIAQEGWQDLSVVEPFVTPDFFAIITDYATDLNAAGYRREGNIAFQAIGIQRQSVTANGFTLVETYICVDLTDSRTVDSSGTAVVDTVPLESQPFVAQVLFSSDQGRIDAEEPWGGVSFC